MKTNINLQENKQLQNKIGFKIISNYLYSGNDIKNDEELIKTLRYEMQKNFTENNIPAFFGEGTIYHTTEKYKLITLAIGTVIQLKHGYSYYGWSNITLIKRLYDESMNYVLKFMRTNSVKIKIQ